MTACEPQVAAGTASRPRVVPARHSAPYVATAALLSIPCVWQPHIETQDLASHLYNAWLSNQAATGSLQGLSVVPQYTNVLFDLLLGWLLRSGNVLFAERIAVILAVQVFFWGCFALVSAVGGRAAWRVAPFVGMLSYGAVFRMGFFNFYLSVGLCAAAIALVWRNHSRLRWWAVPLLLAGVLAHFLVVLWALAVIGYLLVTVRLKSWQRWVACAAGIAGIGATSVLLKQNAPSLWAAGVRIDSMFGVDQALTFGAKYKLIAAGLFCCWILLLVRRLETPRTSDDDIALQVWIMTGAACFLLPDSIWLPFYAGGLSYITIRLSLLAGIFLCASIARVSAPLGERIGQVVVLALFLFFSYSDERAINSVERRVNDALMALPEGSRVVGTFKDSHLYIQVLEHVIDRPCIGRCFDFANYEPSTGQFRLHASPGNTFVISNYDDIAALELRRLEFQRTDIELYRLSACGNEICISRVKPGDFLTRQEVPAIVATSGVF